MTRRRVRDQDQRARAKARWRKAAPWVYAGGGVLVVLLAFLGWAGSRVFVVYQEVSAVQSEAKTLASNAAKFKLDSLETGLGSIVDHLDRARAVTEEPIWGFMAGTPVLGKNLVAAKELIEVLGDTIELAHPLVDWAASFELSNLGPTEGALPVAEIKDALERLQEFGAWLPSLVERVKAIDTSGTLGPIRDGVSVVEKTLASATTSLDSVKGLTEVLPTMLGEDGPRTYVVAFLNNAELRSLGGTALSFVQLTIDQGKIHLDGTIQAGSGGFPQSLAYDPIVPVPDGFELIFPNTYGQVITNVTIRPSFASAAEQIVENFARFRGTKVDDVIGLDAGALASIVGAMKPFELSTGDVVKGSNVVDLLLNEVYVRYQDGGSAAGKQQDAVYSETVAKVFQRVISGKLNIGQFVTSMASDMADGHVSLWSSDPAVQAAFVPFGADNDLPVSDLDVERVGVYYNDFVGSKLGYYLDSSVDLGSALCGPDGMPQHRVTITLTNTLQPEDLESVGRYVRGRSNAIGLERIVVFVYAPPGSTFLGATLDGALATSQAHHDEQYPVVRYTMEMLPGVTQTLVVDYQGPTAGKRLFAADVTPTIRGTKLSDSSVECQPVGVRQVYLDEPPVPVPQPT